MSLEIAFLRHGPTDWNAVHRLQGQTDRPLSRVGREIVSRYRLPADIARHRRICSPMLRARQTAGLLFGLGTPVDDRLREITFGAWDGYTVAELQARWGDRFHRGEALGLDFQPPGGESPRAVRDRVLSFLKDVAEDGRPALVVAHRQVIRAVFALATGWDLTGDPPRKLKFPRLHRFTLDADGRPSVLSLNEAILPPEETSEGTPT